MKVRLRPHHLLCMQTFRGRGYSGGFVENMAAITGLLRSDADAAVEIVFSTDDICGACPKMIGVALCDDNDKVKLLDKKVVDYFGIEERSYLYREITEKINGNITADIRDDICKACQWYPLCVPE